jgi:hypothetical protein
MDAVTKGPFAATMVAAFCVAGMATATAMEPAEIAGRWVSDKEWAQDNYRMTLDISRCGTGWCGVEVKNGATCGRTVLRLDQGAPHEIESFAEFAGRIEVAPGTQPYVVRASIARRDTGLQMHLSGHSGDKFEPWRRNYPYRQLMVRAGDAVCRADPKVS